MKLGKKLDVTDIKERLKLLIDGEIFISATGEMLGIDEEYTFTCGDSFFYDITKEVLLGDWYYPAKEYTINGVTLTDERVNVDNLIHGDIEVFLSSPIVKSKYEFAKANNHTNEWWIDAIERNIAHCTKEAAIAHTNAMIRVSE